MANWKVKLTALGIILIASIIFYFYNHSPVIPLTIVGFETIALPVGLWLILSAIAGLIISILLQLLLKLARPTTPSSGDRQTPKEPEPDPEFQFPEQDDTQANFSTQSDRTTRSRSAQSPNLGQKGNNPSQQASQDWDIPLDSEDWDEADDWNIEQPPPRNSEPIYEMPQTPEQTTQQGSMYAYRYRQPPSTVNPNDNEPEEPEVESTEQDFPSNPEKIYDANYRVIRPPLWNLPDDEEDDEFQDEPKR